MEWPVLSLGAILFYGLWIIADRLNRLGKMLEHWLPHLHAELEKLARGRHSGS